MVDRCQTGVLNLVPILIIGASFSVGFSASALWLGLLVGLTGALFVRDPELFVQSVGRIVPIILAFGFMFTYSNIRATEFDPSASPLNILSALLVIVILRVQYQRYGQVYFLTGLKQLNAAILLTALLGVYETITHRNPLAGIFSYILSEWKMGTPAYRASGIFSHPVPFAHMLTTGMVLTLFLVRRLALKIASLGLLIFALVGTQTRSAWLVVIFILVVLLILATVQKVFSKYIIYAVISMPAILALALFISGSGKFATYSNGLLTRLGALSIDDVSVGQRLGSITAVLNDFFASSDIIELLFGHGLASSNDFINRSDILIENFNTVDNYWLTLLYDFGAIFFVFFVAITVAALRVWKLTLRDVQDASSRALVNCLGLSLLVCLLFMNIYSFTIWRGNQALLILCIATLCSITLKSVPQQRPTVALSQGR